MNTCVCTKRNVSDINDEKEICLPIREDICIHRGERVNMAFKCMVHMHIISDLKSTGFLFNYPLILLMKIVSKLFNKWLESLQNCIQDFVKYS